MIRKTIETPAGETVEIVSNDQWLRDVGGSDLRTIHQWSGWKAIAIRDLWEHGEISDSDGFTVSKWIERIRSSYPHVHLGVMNSLTTLMGQTANAPAFERDTRTGSKRTYSVRLVKLPEMWYEKLSLDLQTKKFAAIPVHTNGTPPPVEPIDNPIEVVETSDSEPVLDIEIASQVAMSLLTAVVEIISGGTPDQANARVRQLESELRETGSRLNSQTERTERMRRTITELGDELSAVKSERDGLRQRLRNTEANLTAALKGPSASLVNAEVQKRIDSMMREVPRPKGE